MQKFSSVQFSRSVVSDSLRPHESQHARPPCPSPTPRVYSNSCPSSWWCHLAISSSFVPFSSCPQSLPTSGSFPMSQLFAWGDQSIGVSASSSVLPVNTQDWSPLGWTGWIWRANQSILKEINSIPGSRRSPGDRPPTPIFLGFPCGSAGKESTCNAGDLNSIPGLERSPGEEKGYPFQYSGLENSMG